MDVPPTPKSPEAKSFRTLNVGRDDVEVQSLMDGMKRPMNSLAIHLDGLHNQTMQVAELGNQIGSKDEITKFCDHVREQDHKHQNGIAEIQKILEQLLQNEVIDHMRRQVEQELADEIDNLVKEHVDHCLKTHIPQELQDEVAESKRELEQIRLALHNSESRRANGTLRSNKPDDLLGTIYMSNGRVSPRYPKDLKSLFSLDSEIIKALLLEYNLPFNDSSDSRDRNLNRLMHFCGVRYQLVPRTAIKETAAQENQ